MQVEWVQNAAKLNVYSINWERALIHTSIGCLLNDVHKHTSLACYTLHLGSGSDWDTGYHRVTTGLKPCAHEKNSRNRFKREADAKSAICLSYPPSSFLSFPSPSLYSPSLFLFTFPHFHLPTQPCAYFSTTKYYHSSFVFHVAQALIVKCMV